MPFIFPRRYIQQCLDILRTVLTDDQHTDLVARLNRRNADRLPAMWEAVVLRCFAGQQDFKHEESLENGRKPDFQFRLLEADTHVVGDITCVSDNGSKKVNPIELLMDDINRIARSLGSDRTQFHVQVGAEHVGDYNKRRVVLKLPKGPDRQRFLKEELKPYMIKRLNTEDYGHRQVFSSEDYNVEVTFKPKSQYASHGHPTFTNVLHIDRNPVWNALKSKADQLRRAPSGAFRVLVLCDGGCDALRDRGSNSGISREEIVVGFLKRNSGIDAVILMTVADEREAMGQTRKVHRWSWAVDEKWLQSDVRNSTVAAQLQHLINSFGSGLPKPASNAQSAVKNCLTMDYGIGSWGGYTMAGNTFEISARALQRVLAGEISVEEFNREYKWPNGNFFATALSRGQTISNISMVRRDVADDDYVEITFAPDAALSPFS